MGLSVDFTPRHAARYAEVGEIVVDALRRWADDVRTGGFPTEAQTTHIKEPLDLGSKTLSPPE